jgi:hypothetical protein
MSSELPSPDSDYKKINELLNDGLDFSLSPIPIPIDETYDDKHLLGMDTKNIFSTPFDDGHGSYTYNNEGVPEGYNDVSYSEKSVLKSVYCNYRGYLIVYDVHGEKVKELSGKITYEKHLEIEARLDENITEFEGIDDYSIFVKELEEDIKNKSAINNGFVSNNVPKLPDLIIASNVPTPNPIAGDMYYDVSLSKYGVYDGKQWRYYQISDIQGSPVKNPPNRQAPRVQPNNNRARLELDDYIDEINKTLEL